MDAKEVRSLHFLLVALLATIHIFALTANGLGFQCSSTTSQTCQSLVGYIPSENTTLADVAAKFGLPSYFPLLGPNSLPINASGHHPVGAADTVRIPIPCRCTKGRGYSDRIPVHKVQDGEFLYQIATEVFSGLVDFPAIATVNRIPDPNTIHKGQRLWIPLPCSCDPVRKDFPATHFAQLVMPGSTMDGIAAEFGLDQDVIVKLNDIRDPTLLVAGQVLDVPLRVCSSAIRKTSLDRSLAVTNGSYALTAHDCVQCKCSTSWQLQCVPNPLANGSKCPSMQCKGTHLVIGESAAGNACGPATCSYAGYTNQTILTAITGGPTCSPAASPAPQPIGALQPTSALQATGVPPALNPTVPATSSAEWQQEAGIGWQLIFYVTLTFLSSALPWVY